MSRLWLAVMTAMTLAAAGPAPAQIACSPNALGTVRCPNVGVVPPPRPIYRKPVQGLDRVRAKPELENPNPDFVPSQELNTLGEILTEGGGVGNGSCRSDALGNMHCD